MNEKSAIPSPKTVNSHPSTVPETESGQHVSYDENLLERARTQWQFGDWESLAKLDRDTLQHHPDRAKLALFAAAGRLQLGETNEARTYLNLAKDWGVSPKLIAQILIAGVHNSLARCAAIGNQSQRALQHFRNSVLVGTPGSDIKLLVQARTGYQLSQLGLVSADNPINVGIGDIVATPTKPSLASRHFQTLADTLIQHKEETETQLKKQAEDIISVRKYLESVVKKEIGNATKQIEAVIGLQSYFASGQLPNINTERHTWPVSPDFALYLIELIELNDYDLIIEFGSGLSTVIIAKTIAKNTDKRSDKQQVCFFSFDHLETYYQKTLSQLKQAGLAERVQLIHSPLQDWLASNGSVYPFYSCESALSALAKKHPPTGLRMLVIVDGPPAATGKHARYPAAPLILKYFAGAHIDLLLDDYIREDEKEIAKLWQADVSAAKLAYTTTERKLEKDAFLLSIYGRKNAEIKGC